MKIHISKLDAAKRQLDSAIALFFHSGDVISIHTLASASYDLLKALCDKNGINNYMVKNESFVREDKKMEFRQAINKAQNFFKHADRDHNSILEFSPEFSEYFLWDATHMYSQLTSEHPPLFMLYRLWIAAKHPDTILMIYATASVQGADSLQALQSLNLDPNNREKFFELLPMLTKLALTLRK